ncbi:hypothetical protein B0A49_05928 [Cryomyces minteri]|uniref:pyridoxal kinase n=2 Tax=Cryomyces minteri TaxID=331657 RepID=A0A4U0WWS2_9PEZI|nr:hypothetical protein B0A49_05928 [Cryomyces minteri]
MAEIPETSVLAIASHVAYGHVGNTMATFVMQSLGLEVSAINTVEYSNHTAYKQVKGRKTPADEITELYDGLKQSYLNDFDMMLSGYCPSAEVVQAVGKIARDLRFNAMTKPGSFFWVLDPVMGDEGRLYVSSDIVPAYKALLNDADLILPNQFEAELLSDTKITDVSSLTHAITLLHRIHRLTHIVITSLRLSVDNIPSRTETLSVVGSTMRSDLSPRLFRIDVPAFPCFFSGTGDMFAALTVARLREAALKAGLDHTAHWQSPDSVAPTHLPLAEATEKVLASMQSVLRNTMTARDKEIHRLEKVQSPGGVNSLNEGTGEEGVRDRQMKQHLRETKAAEVRVVRNVRDLVHPPVDEVYRAVAVEGKEADPGTGDALPDELGVVKVGGGEGATHQT